MLIELLLAPLLAGCAVALVAGPMGAFVVWRRMAFFGDTLAHGALLGAALSLGVGISLYPGVVVVCLLLALLLVALQQQHHLASDTLLGIVAHTTLAAGVIAVMQTDVQVDLFAFLFGDLLAVQWSQLAWLWGGSALIVIMVVAHWRSLLSITVSEDLARVEGVPVLRTRLVLMLLLALLIAGAIRTVGVLLITSLLVIPPAAARRLAATPERMAVLASVIGLLAVFGGLALSWFADTPVGPSIVVAAAGLFLLSLLRRPA